MIYNTGMPVYEYLCKNCNRQFSRFFWKISDAEGTKCRCGSEELEQLVSRVSMQRSEESRLENLADPSQWGDIDENDFFTLEETGTIVEGCVFYLYYLYEIEPAGSIELTK